VYALLSTVFTGVGVFMHKIAVERGYTPTVMTVVGDFVIILFAFIALIFTGSGENHWMLGLLFGSATGLIYVVSMLMRMESLKHIDTAIFFPLYKTISPLIALVVGILFFNEWFTKLEALGIMLGIVVPLLLIHKSEHARQGNLHKGLVFLTVTAFLTIASQAMAKHGTSLFDNIFIFIIMSTTFSMLGGIAIHMFKSKKSNIINTDFKNMKIIMLATCAGTMQFASYSLVMFAYKTGSLAIVYTINSFYILIPIILSIIIYQEHWNARKAFAIGLSIVALAFLH